MISLTWEQVHAWRLEQQGLVPRLGRPHLIRAVADVLGVQAQVMSAAELAIGARVEGLTRADVQRALWQDRTLVQTWAMRGTIHVFAAEDLPLVVAARCAEGGATGSMTSSNLALPRRSTTRSCRQCRTCWVMRR